MQGLGMATPSNQANAAILSSVRTEILIAFVFSLLAMVVFAIMAVVYGGIALFASAAPAIGTLTVNGAAVPAGSPAAGGWLLFSSIFGIVALVVLAMLAISVATFIHINRMRNAADAGDVTRLKALNSVGWAILALIFNGLVAGILLLVAHGPITDLK